MSAFTAAARAASACALALLWIGPAPALAAGIALETQALSPAPYSHLAADSSRRALRHPRLEPSALRPFTPTGTPVNASWREIVPPGPTRRQPGVTAWDAAHDRLIVVAGSDQSAYYTEIWALASGGSWSRLDPFGTPPVGRPATCGIFDPVSNRVILFGGYRNGKPAWADLWSLTLTDPPVWTPITPAGPAPAGRWNALAVYDAARRRMLMYGGETDAGKCSETWALSLDGAPAWTPLATSGDPPPRALPSVAFDPVRNRLVVIGGVGVVNEFYGDTWSLDLATAVWSPLPSAGNAIGVLDGASLTYDPAGDRLVLFGGNTGIYGENHRLDGLWSLDLAHSTPWAPLAASGPSPSPRFAQGAVLDPARGRIVMFGGVWDSPVGDTWALSLGALPQWIELSAPVHWPDALAFHSTVVDSRRNRMLVLSGGTETLIALPLSGPSTWQFIPTVGGPTPQLANASAIYDPDSDRVVLFGGYGGPYGVPINDTWSLSLSDPPTWRALAPGGTLPRIRDNAVALYDAPRRRMLVYGGDNDYDFYRDDAFALNLDGAPVWTPITPAGTRPSGRSQVGAVLDPARDRLVVTGGRGDLTYSASDVWALGLADGGAWTQLAPEFDYRMRRAAAVSVLDAANDRMLVWSGFPYAQLTASDLWSVDLASGAWQALDVVGASPPARGGGSGIYDPAHQRMVIWGGTNGVQSFHDLWNLDWQVPTPVTSALVEARIEGEVARLAWWLGGGDVAEASLERRSGSEAFREVARTRPDGTGRVDFADSGLDAGRLYEYRLAWTEGSIEHRSASAWLQTPAAAAFALQGARPNPAVFDLTVAFSLAERGEARLSLTDVAGRRVVDRTLAGFEPGNHAVKLGSASDLAPGLYLVTLRQRTRVASCKVAVIRE